MVSDAEPETSGSTLAEAGVGVMGGGGRGRPGTATAITRN